jgi:hypothetical protein
VTTLCVCVCALRGLGWVGVGEKSRPFPIRTSKLEQTTAGNHPSPLSPDVVGPTPADRGPGSLFPQAAIMLDPGAMERWELRLPRSPHFKFVLVFAVCVRATRPQMPNVLHPPPLTYGPTPHICTSHQCRPRVQPVTANVDHLVACVPLSS